jgi:cytochrome c-type biogenesis protein
MTGDISYFLAFSAGVLSFLSPCVLPLIPSYFSYLTGLSSEEIRLNPGQTRAVVLKNAVMFVLGFSVLFILFGASATFIGKFLLSHQEILRQVGGFLIVFFGLYILGLIKLPFLMRDIRFHFQDRPAGLIGSFLIGVAFGAGWTPCVGPILGSILLYAGMTQSVLIGILLLMAYSLGLAVPFLLTALGVNIFLGFLKGRSLLWLNRLSGAFLILVGVMIFTNSLTLLTAYFSEIGVGWLVGQ